MNGRRAHHDRGWRRVLDLAWAYDAVQSTLSRPQSGEHYVRDCVRPFPGCRILDIGCGTAGILAHLPADGSYVGFDMSPAISMRRAVAGERGENSIAGT